MSEREALQMIAAISAKAMVGRQGFHFLGGEASNHLTDYLSGIRDISPHSLRILRCNSQVMQSLPCPSVALIVPEAHVIYPDFLPDNFFVSPARPARRIMAEMPGAYLYPEQELRDFRAAGGSVYSGRDSHWRRQGALAAWKIMRAKLGLTKPYNCSFDTETDPYEIGDLVLADENERRRRYREQIEKTLIRGPEYTTCFNYIHASPARTSAISNPDAPYGRLLAFGSSFSSYLQICYRSDFREVILFNYPTVDPLLVELIRPDYVVTETPERFLPSPTSSQRGAIFYAFAGGWEKPGSSATAGTLGDLADQIPPGLKGVTDLCRMLIQDGRLSGSLREMVPEDVAERLDHIASLSVDHNFRWLMTHVMTGHFRREDMQQWLNHALSSFSLAVRTDLLPETEMGLLIAVRLHILHREFEKARAALDRAGALFGNSAEVSYYTAWLARQP